MQICLVMILVARSSNCSGASRHVGCGCQGRVGFTCLLLASTTQAQYSNLSTLGRFQGGVVSGAGLLQGLTDLGRLLVRVVYGLDV